MAEVSISVGGRAYSIACDDGQEERVASLAARIDAEAAAFAGGGVISEARLLLMSALMIADKLDEAEGKATEAEPVQTSPEPQTAAADEAPDLFAEPGASDAEAIEEINAAIARVEALATSWGEDIASNAIEPVAPSEEMGEAAASEDAGTEAAQSSDSDATPDDAAQPKPMTREEMRALRRERRRLAMERAQQVKEAQQENNG